MVKLELNHNTGPEETYGESKDFTTSAITLKYGTRETQSQCLSSPESANLTGICSAVIPATYVIRKTFSLPFIQPSSSPIAKRDTTGILYPNSDCRG